MPRQGDPEPGLPGDEQPAESAHASAGEEPLSAWLLRRVASDAWCAVSDVLRQRQGTFACGSFTSVLVLVSLTTPGLEICRGRDFHRSRNGSWPAQPRPHIAATHQGRLVGCRGCTSCSLDREYRPELHLQAGHFTKDALRYGDDTSNSKSPAGALSILWVASGAPVTFQPATADSTCPISMRPHFCAGVSRPGKATIITMPVAGCDCKSRPTFAVPLSFFKVTFRCTASWVYANAARW